MFKIKLPNKTSVGLYIESPEVTDTLTKNIKLKQSYKIMLRVRGENKKQGKRVFNFEGGTSLTKAIDEVNAQRSQLIEEIEALTKGQTLRTKKVVKVDEASLTLEEAWDLYISRKKREVRASTIHQYESIFSLRYKHLYNRTIKSITTEDLQEAVDLAYKEAKTFLPATNRLMIATIKPFLKANKVVIDWDELKVKVNNRRDFKWPLEDSKKLVKALRGYYEPEIQGVFTFLLSGRRIGEVLNMTHEQISGDTWNIPIENSKSKEALSFVLDDDMKRILRERKGGVYVFSVGKFAVRNHFYNLLDDLKLPRLHLHDLRSLVATVLYQSGIPIQEISSMLGHKDLKTTIARYVTADHTTQSNTAQTAFKALIDD